MKPGSVELGVDMVTRRRNLVLNADRCETPLYVGARCTRKISSACGRYCWQHDPERERRLSRERAEVPKQQYAMLDAIEKRGKELVARLGFGRQDRFNGRPHEALVISFDDVEDLLARLGES